MIRNCLLKLKNEESLAAYIINNNNKAHNDLWHIIGGNLVCRYNTMYVGFHSKGIFYCNRGPGKGLRNFKWNKLQGGDRDIPQSAKRENLCC